MTTSSTSPSPSAGRPEPGAAGVLVGRLFAEHGRMVLGLCRLLLRNPTDAEDAAQQVFLSAHRALLGGAVPREAPAWLAAIARNECRARIRTRMREPLALNDLPSDLPDPLASAIRAMDLDAVWKAISSLPRRQRNALVLRELGGLSYHELGRALGVSDSSIESLLFRARRQVRAALAGANAAALPVALRDELARLIPGFDPAGVGLVARAAALPIGLKVATAAVGIGAVTTGAAKLPEPHSHPSRTPAVVALAPVQQREAKPQRAAARLVSVVRTTSARAATVVRAKPQRHEDGPAAAERSRHEGEAQAVEPKEQAPSEPARETSDVADSEPAAPEEQSHAKPDSSGKDQPDTTDSDPPPDPSED